VRGAAVLHREREQAGAVGGLGGFRRRQVQLARGTLRHDVDCAHAAQQNVDVGAADRPRLEADRAVLDDDAVGVLHLGRWIADPPEARDGGGPAPAGLSPVA
jgi:hypothetical protein